MIYLVMIVGAVFGYWIVSFLISQLPSHHPQQQPSRSPANGMPDRVVWACQVLQVNWPVDHMTLQAAYQRMASEYRASANADQQRRDVEEAYAVLQQALSGYR